MLKEAASQFAPNNLVPSTKVLSTEAQHVCGCDAIYFLQLNSVVEELNVLLADESTGGGAVGGHSLTMAMHLLHQLKSARKFTELLTTKFDVLVNNVRCLHPINQQLKVAISCTSVCNVCSTHLFSEPDSREQGTLVPIHASRTQQPSCSQPALPPGEDCHVGCTQCTSLTGVCRCFVESS